MKFTNFVLISVSMFFGVVNADRFRIVAETCNVWKKQGVWINSTDDARLVHWEQRCESLSPSDLIFSDATTGVVIGRTDEQLTSWTTTIRIRDAEDNIVAMLTEELITHIFTRDIYTSYSISVGENGPDVATSQETRLWDGHIAWTEGSSTICNGEQSGSNGVAAAFCVDDSYWDVSFNSAQSNISVPHWWYMAAMTTKAVRDVDRDSDGRVSSSLCQKANVLLIVLLCVFLIPCGLFLIGFGVAWFGFGRCSSVAHCLRCPTSLLDCCRKS